MKRVYPIEERCINCHLCEVACIVEHSQTKDPIAAYHLEGLRFNWEYCADTPDPAEALEWGRPKPLSRCWVEVNGYISLSVSCRHCEEPECVLACKTGALYKAPDGRVLLQEDKCVGCWMCIMACPYGAVSRNPLVKNVPQVRFNGINHHCDLCAAREREAREQHLQEQGEGEFPWLPACVMICPTQALVYEERTLAE
ncbi:MAG TPA: 4Fe-4S dicluster domain-containing protein [Piscirickettsiaceae bacterium]|nr:4Fe-4S dicluster domain-containing protein [Piscirickettsiaceae bacterium]